MVGLFSISLSVLCIFDEPLMPLLYFSSLEEKKHFCWFFFSLHDGLFCISLSFFVSLISLCCCYIFTPKPLIVILCSLCYTFLDFGYWYFHDGVVVLYLWSASAAAPFSDPNLWLICLTLLHRTARLSFNFCSFHLSITYTIHIYLSISRYVFVNF